MSTTRAPRRRRTPPAPDRPPLTLLIERLGAEGDGIGITPAGVLVHVEGALPGERVIAGGTARLLGIDAILDPAPSRATAICRLAPRCGGCTLQHMDRDALLAWKVSRVRGALTEAGYDAPNLRPAFETPLGARRRLALAFARAPDGAVRLGLHRRSSTEIVDMTECHVLAPSLFALVAPLRALLPRLALAGSQSGQIMINGLEHGADLLLRTGRTPSAADRTRLAAFALANGVARIAWHDDARSAPETLVQQAPVAIAFGGRVVEPPPGAFLQAATAAEHAIRDDVVEAVTGRRARRPSIVELFAGCGTLTFPLASVARVTAYEGDAAAHAALERASGGTRVIATRRDLVRAPVSRAELRHADAVVLDPPHAGAGAQIDEVAASAVETVVLVSCNPASLAREARALREAGYRLEASRAIDQFVYSARIESVSVFRRETTPARAARR